MCCDSVWLALVPKRGLSLEAVPAGAGRCPLQQLGSGWMLKQPLAATLSSGQRQPWKLRPCHGFLCYGEQAAGSLVGCEKAEVFTEC